MPFFLFIIGRSMKWFTHKAVAVAGALAAGAHPAALFAVMIGSVLPDMVDTAMARGDKKVWRRIHRQTSHWFGWYLVIIILGFLIPTQRIVLDLLRATHITFPGVSPSALAQVSGIGNDLLVWVGIGGSTSCWMPSRPCAFLCILSEAASASASISSVRGRGAKPYSCSWPSEP